MARSRKHKKHTQPASPDAASSADRSETTTQSDAIAASRRYDRSFAVAALIVALAAWGGLAGFVYTFAAIGQPFVDGLDERVGEVLAARADRLAKGYRFDEAIALYQQAIDTGFQDEPAQRLYAYRDLIALYERLGRYDEGIEAARRALEVQWNYVHAFTPLYRMLRATDRYDDALELMRSHFERAQAESNVDEMVTARFNEGVILEQLDRGREALDAYRAAYVLRQEPRTALNIAALLGAMDKSAEMGEYLALANERGNESEQRRARSMARKYGVALER